MFSGTYTALVTPFRNTRVDEPAFEKLIQEQVRAGVDGIVPVGTTGESPSLGFEEHIRVLELAVRSSRGRIKVLAGTGANSTTEAVHLTKAAEAAGADGSLQVAPYYNKPSQEGVFRHFRKIAKSTRLPIILYSIPGRCNISIEAATIVRLSKACSNIVGIQEAGGDADRVTQLRAALGQRFTILSGDDALTLPFMAVGAVGVISVASNIIPRQVARMVTAFATGQLGEALKLHQKYYPVFSDLFLETNPVPVKAALAMLGKCSEEYRLPLCKMSTLNRTQLAKTLKACGVLKNYSHD